jgi:eukaryotic-like serine/threonine-protein kinase
MTEERTSVVPGGLVGGRFRLEQPLGRGAMGSVWTAWHTTLNVRVAIKFIGTELAAREDLRSRFEQEAQAAAQIDSPHVVRVIDHGVDETGRPYIAMEMLRGQSLADRLKQEPVLSIALLARIITHTAKGLAKAHKLGIIHRDIKPENLFLSEDDEEGVVVKVLDFGIAKATTFGGKAHQTGTGHLMGTPHYMSPEQALGNKQIDHRSDLYSLGVVAYRCLTGAVPFESGGLGALIVAITTQPHAPLSTRRPDLGTILDPWFAGALSKDPNQRFQNARDLARAFVEAARALDPNAVVSGAAGGITLGSWNDTTGVRASDVRPAMHSAVAASAMAAQPMTPVPAQPMAAQPMAAQPMTPVPAQPMAAQPMTPVPAQPVAPMTGVPFQSGAPSTPQMSAQEQGPTLQGASAATIEDPPTLPMRRSVLPLVIVGFLGLGGVVGGTVWWLAIRTTAPTTSSAELISSSDSQPASADTETTAPSEPIASNEPPDATPDVEAAAPTQTTPPARTTRPGATGKPPPEPKPPASAPAPTSTVVPSKDIKRGCTTNAQCKGDRVCVKGECKNK